MLIPLAAVTAGLTVVGPPLEGPAPVINIIAPAITIRTVAAGGGVAPPPAIATEGYTT